MLGNARSGEACVPGACCPLGIAAQIPGTDRRPGFATTGFPRFPGSRTAEPRQTQRFHQQKSRAAGAAPSLVLSQLCRHHGAPLGHSAKYVTLPHVGHKDYELQNLTRAPAKSSARPRRCQHPCSTAPLTAPHCGSRLMPGSASQ